MAGERELSGCTSVFRRRQPQSIAQLRLSFFRSCAQNNFPEDLIQFPTGRTRSNNLLKRELRIHDRAYESTLEPGDDLCGEAPGSR